MSGGTLRTAIAVGVGVVLLLAAPVLAREVGAFAGVAAVAVAAVICLLAGAVARRRRVRAQLRVDPRPPVLFLRPDEPDGPEPAGPPPGYTEQLSRALHGIGPLLPVDSPTEAQLGSAGLVLLHAGTSTGLLRELSRVVATERPDRLIVCLPVGSPRAGRRPDPARERYTRFRLATAGILPDRLPPSADGAAFLYSKPTGRRGCCAPATRRPALADRQLADPVRRAAPAGPRVPPLGHAGLSGSADRAIRY